MSLIRLRRFVPSWIIGVEEKKQRRNWGLPWLRRVNGHSFEIVEFKVLPAILEGKHP